MSFNVVMLWLPFWKRFFIVQGVAIRKPRPKDTFWGKGRTCRRILQGLGCERPRQLGGIFEANLRWICSCQRDFICMIWLKNIEEYHLRPCEKSHWSKAVGTLWGGFLWLSVLGTSSSSASTYSKDKAEHIRQVIDVFEMYLDDLTKFNKIWQVTVTTRRSSMVQMLLRKMFLRKRYHIKNDILYMSSQHTDVLSPCVTSKMCLHRKSGRRWGQ